MLSSQSFGAGQGVTEISGRPGQVWGTVVIPTGGKTTMRISGDTLYTATKVNFGLESKEIFTRIQEIDSIEITEGRIWWLLAIGIPTAFWIIGIVFIVLFFAIKQNWIVIHTPKSCLILFHNDTSRVKQFCNNLLVIARQLNAKNPANGNAANRANQRPSAHNGSNGNERIAANNGHSTPSA